MGELKNQGINPNDVIISETSHVNASKTDISLFSDVLYI